MIRYNQDGLIHCLDCIQFYVCLTFVKLTFQESNQFNEGVADMERDNDGEILNVHDDTHDGGNVNDAQDIQKVKTVKVPFVRERKKSVYLQDPFTDPPPTTPRVRIKHKQKFHKKTLKTLLGADGKEIQLEAWKEVHTL